MHAVRATSAWSLTTTYAQVLLCIVEDPLTRVRDIAQITGLAERTVNGVIGRLVADGALIRQRSGRRNQYEINEQFSMGHRVEATADLGTWLVGLAAARRHSAGTDDDLAPS